MTTREVRRAAGAGALIALALAVAACGSSSKKSSNAQPRGTVTDRAFVNDMTPHHESAIEMATIAERRAEHAEIKRRAASIVSAQRSEIREMSGLKRRLSAGGASASLGLSDQAMGMTMHTAELSRAKPFDRAFIDMMRAHHRGAIEMAKVELARGADSAAKALARRIIAAQTREIAEMSSWRKRWYGAHTGSGMHGMHG